MDWNNQVVFDQVSRHLRLANGRAIVVVVTPTARVRYQDAIGRLATSVQFVAEPPIDVSDVSVVISLSEDIPSSRAHYASLNATKERGAPVVFCLPERRLCTETPTHPHEGTTEGMFALAGVYAQTIKPSGSYLEFGVYDGRTIALAFHTMATACDRFFAFDSFKGIGGATAQEQSHFANGQYYANLATLDYNLRFTGVDVARVTPVAGFFEDTLAGRTPRDYGIESASVVHIDTDVYAPALQALEFVTSALPQGALLLFDDYDQLAASNRKGERRAVREWLERHDDIELEEYRRYTPFSRAFIVHRT